MNIKSFKLEGFDDIVVLQPGIQYYIDLIKSQHYFAFIKRTHGFWDLLVDLQNSTEQAGVHDNIDRPLKQYILKLLPYLNRKNIQRRKEILDKLEETQHYKYFWKDAFIDELLRDLQEGNKNNNFIEAISFRGYPREGPHTKLLDAKYDKDELRKALLSYVSKQPIWHDALVWKYATFSGDLLGLFSTMQTLRIILIGPPHLESLGRFLKIKDFKHVSIHPTEAIKDRAQILNELSSIVENSGNVPCVCIFQAGTLAFWLIYRMFRNYPNVFYLDIGRVLDIWYPEIVSPQPWFKNNKDLIISKMHLEPWYK